MDFCVCVRSSVYNDFRNLKVDYLAIYKTILDAIKGHNTTHENRSSCAIYFYRQFLVFYVFSHLYFDQRKS